jgi:hypothetical protein
MANVFVDRLVKDFGGDDSHRASGRDFVVVRYIDENIVSPMNLDLDLDLNLNLDSGHDKALCLANGPGYVMKIHDKNGLGGRVIVIQDFEGGV